MMEERVKTEICDWIVRAALAGRDEVEIVAGVCQRLASAGVVAGAVLGRYEPARPHSRRAEACAGTRARGALEEVFLRTDDTRPTEDWMRSPFFFLVESRQPSMRRRLDATYRRGEFPMLDGFLDQGVTDYLAFAERVSENLRLGEGEGVVSSWTTDAPAGFSDAEVEMLAGIMPALTLAFMLRTTNSAARTLITTYLGSDAAERVLAGNIVRGRAQPIRAVVWFSDLTSFTRISDSATPDVVLALLNDYAEAQVEEIEAHGGHVLKFMGDGILAIFPDDDTTRACKRALDAAASLRRRIAALNERRHAAGLPVTDTHLALHVGELLYGNLGSPRRLDFTVLGAAVNEAARIGSLCASLEQSVIVSWAFADAAGERTACAREPGPLRDEGDLTTAGIVHAGSRLDLVGTMVLGCPLSR